MQRNREESQRPGKTIQIWSHEQAISALPYIRSVMQSAREHGLEAQQSQLKLKRLQQKPGRSDRHAIIEEKSVARDCQLTRQRFDEDIEELMSMDIYCLDPIQGLALIPFVHDNQLSWFVYDLFDEQPVRFWRYHQDPLEKRRPIAEVQGGGTEPLIV